MDNEYVAADKTTRLKYIGLIGLGLGLIILSASLVELVYPRFTGQTGLAACDYYGHTLYQLLGFAFISALIFGFFAAYLFRLALRVKRAGRWPPPDFKVPFRTRIRYGTYVTATWVMLFACSGLSVIQPVLAIYTWSSALGIYSDVCSRSK